MHDKIGVTLHYGNLLTLKVVLKCFVISNLLDLLCSDDGELKCRVYDKGDDFNFYIFNYPFMYSSIPVIPAYNKVSMSHGWLLLQKYLGLQSFGTLKTVTDCLFANY